MEIRIFKYIPNKFSIFPNEVIHKIKFPSNWEPKRYISLISLSAFNHGRKKNATKEQRAKYMDSCCYSPQGLYYCKLTEEQWLKENEVVKHLYDETTLAVVEHESLWDFYKYIGFNHKKRKYDKSL